MYYLPININDRRVHICELKSETECAGNKDWDKPIFGFLFTGDTLFTTGPRGDNELIGRNAPNVPLKDYHIECSKIDDICSLPAYQFSFVENTNEYYDHKFNNVPFAVNPDAESFSNYGVQIKFRCKGGRKIVEDRFVIRLHFAADDENYYYQFKGYNALSGIAGNITDAAIDFGSEASQVRLGEARININQVLRDNYYKSFHRLSNTKTVETEDLWQYEKNPTFYKSAYFVHKEPGLTKYADEPNNNKEKSFIQTLLPLKVEPEYYNDLLLLPNLKLLDLLGHSGGAVGASNMSTNIKVMPGSEILYKVDTPNMPVNSTNMTDADFRQNTLRVILCNLLHCIMANTQPIDSNASKTLRYLRLVMLMPNVYDQKKVYDIVEGLYKDYDTIVDRGRCAGKHLYDGFEVAVISESDAAFLGAITKYNAEFDKLKFPERQYYLIIDAGKGTTDFSIMHTSDNNLCVWNSLYRGGLPASGNALTFAVYEAVWAFFMRTRQINLDELLSNNKEMSFTKEFMDYLEEMKRNYSSFAEKEDSEITPILAKTISTLGDVNENLKKIIIKKGILVEGTKNIVRDKAILMSKMVVKGISGYMKSQHPKDHFGMVLFTGRGFMLEPFVEEMKKALKESHLITEKTAFTQFNGDALKTVCIDGSTNIGGKFWINNNSELVCKPIIERDKKFKLFNKSKFLPDDEFFYSGIQISHSKNARLRMGLGVSLLNQTESVHFVGRGLLVKSSHEDIIDPLVFQQTLDAEDAGIINKLTLESLFPYHSGSIPDPFSHKPLYEPQSKGKSSQTTAHSPNTNTIGTEPNITQPQPLAPESIQSGNSQEINPDVY